MLHTNIRYDRSDILATMTIAENTRENYSPLGIEEGSLETGELILKAFSFAMKANLEP